MGCTDKTISGYLGKLILSLISFPQKLFLFGNNILHSLSLIMENVMPFSKAIFVKPFLLKTSFLKTLKPLPQKAILSYASFSQNQTLKHFPNLANIAIFSKYFFVLPRPLRKLIGVVGIFVCLYHTYENFTNMASLLISILYYPLKCNSEEIILEMLSLKGILKYFISELSQK